MSSSTTPETSATTETSDNHSDVDASQVGIPEPNIDLIRVLSQPSSTDYYKGFAPTGIAKPNANDAKTLGLNGFNTLEGHLQAGQAYSVSYCPIGGEVIVISLTATYVETKFGVAHFKVVNLPDKQSS